MLKRPRGSRGWCIRGSCISWSGGGIPGWPSLPPEPFPSCNEIVSAVGYTTACFYDCLSANNRPEKRPYPDGTPCLEVAEGQNKRAGPAGLCRSGKCIPHYDIEGDYSTVVANVFPPRLNKCPQKPFLGKMAVFDCHHYCKIGENWFHGSYTGNTTCQTEEPNVLGWCCYGSCYQKMWCGRNENSVDYPRE